MLFCKAFSVLIYSVQSFSHLRPLATPWTAARQASLSITSSWSLLKLMSIESVMPSNHLILCHPLLLPSSIFPSIRVFSNESVLPIRWPKYWSFSYSISPSSEYGLISFWNDWFDLLADQGDHILWFYQFVKESKRDQFGPEAGKSIQQGTGSERKRWGEFSCVMSDVKRSSDSEPEQRRSWWRCSWCMKCSKPTATPVTKRTLRGLPGTLSFWTTYWITVFDAHFLCCFIVVKKTSHQMEDAS